MTRSEVHTQSVSATPLQCKAGDIGQCNYLQCLEDTKEGRACDFRFPFGFDYLCDSPERSERMRREK